MVHNKREAHPLMAPVTWSSDQEIDLSFITPVRERWMRASIVVRQWVNDYMLTMLDLGEPIDDPMLERMLDAAERKERESAARDGREPEIVRERIQPFTHAPVVYYMRMDRLVKIGTSSDLRTRVAAVMAQGVMAVEWGDRELERERHNQFVDLHSHLEWFRLASPLVDHIADLRERFETDHGVTVEQWLAERRVPNRAPS